jgi:hypothetical protein
MGYCMSQQESVFTIKPESFAGALAAIKELGREHSYSWVITQEFVDADTLKKALKAWRWNLEIDEETGVACDLYFDGSKLGDDETLFHAIAPFVEKGSYIQMQGEDGHLWRWEFDGTRMRELSATISWG